MELYQLRYFRVVAETEHFTKAAEQLHIAQPSLSKAIANLETELGVLLFERKNRAVHLTEYGSAFLEHAVKIIEEAEVAQLEIQDMVGEAKGDIHIGSCAVFSAPSLIYMYNRKAYLENRNMGLHFYHMDTTQIEQYLLEHRLDFGLSVSVPEHFEIQATELLSYRLGIVMSKKHPLAGRESIHLMELKDDNFLCNNTSPDLKDSLYDMCHQAGFEPKVVFEGEFADLIGEAVADNRGVAFISIDRHNYKMENGNSEGAKNLVLVPLEDDFCVRTVYLLEEKDRYLPVVAKRYRDGLIEFVEKSQK